MDLIRHRAERKNRELRNVEQALKNEELRLKNQDRDIKNKTAALQLLQSVFAASKKYGCSPEELQESVTLLASTQQIPIPTPQDAGLLPGVSPKLLGG